MNNELMTAQDLRNLYKKHPEGYTMGLENFRYIVGVTKETSKPIIYANGDEIDFEDLATRLSGLQWVSMMCPELQLSLGWWTEPGTGNVHYDVVQGFNNEFEAIHKAQELNEIAYWDSVEGVSLNTPKKP